MKVKNWVTIVIGILLLFVIGLYIYQANFFTKHFYPKATANGVSIGQMTQAEAEAVLAKQSENEMLQITDKGQPWKEIQKKELGIEYDFSKSLADILAKQNNYLWLISYFKTFNHTLSDSSLNEENLKTYTEGLKEELTALNEQRTPSKNAVLEKKEGTFEIVPEVQGDDYDLEKVITGLSETLASGGSQLELTDYQTSPSIKADNGDLKANLDKISAITDQKVTYLINGQSIAVEKNTLVDWVDYSEKDNTVNLNKDKVKTYVANLGQQYNTSSNPTLFKSTKRGDVSVPAGTYSWTIQTDAEADELYNSILAGKGVERSPIILGSASVGPALIGSTYVEVDLVNQHMYYYKDGAIALETPIVSGKPTTVTPPGVNYVWNKERNSTLRGTNDDGSKYATPVDYWLPIDWTGVGIHDSNWQPNYGGELWKTVGSHGCINTPPSVMAKLYNMIEVGTPVLIF